MRSNPELDNPMFPIDMAFVSQVTNGDQSPASIRRVVRALPITYPTLVIRLELVRSPTIFLCYTISNCNIQQRMIYEQEQLL